MSNIAGSSVYSTANTSTSTLRPRNNRLISYLEDPLSDNDTPSQTSAFTTSRGHSPSTVNAHHRNVTQAADKSSKHGQARPASDNAARRSSLWDSWSSIQGAATSFLGGGEGSTTLSRKGSLKTPAWMKQDPRYKTATSTPKWGPDSKSSKAAVTGTIEDRQALVQAKKREALLLSCAQDSKDELGHYKRKASYDAGVIRATNEADLGKDALVYKHKVRPGDTMAGVTIKYSCQPEAFRKVNRFWPNDNIQTRKYVLLPVEACGIRGQKVDDLTSLELLTKQLDDVAMDSKHGSTSPTRQQSASTISSPTMAPPKHISADEENHQHDCYVTLSAFDEPVEILRIPRKSLGYFPRTRRKSTHRTPESLESTPKTSFDMLRHPPTHAAQQAAAALHSISNAPDSSPARPRLSSTSRQRSSSTTASANTNSNNAWILRGPGGVGTLRGLRTEVSRPGPAEDPLNQKFAHYFPGLALKPDSEDNTGGYNSLVRPRTNAMSRSPYRSTPRASMDSVRSTRSNSSTFGAGVTGVENFMRKLTSGGKRPDMMPRSSSGNLAGGFPIGGETGLGDLIELETNPDALHRDQSPLRLQRMERSNYDFEDDDATPTAVTRNHEDQLNEHFPVRGRITRAYRGDDG